MEDQTVFLDYTELKVLSSKYVLCVSSMLNVSQKTIDM